MKYLNPFFYIGVIIGAILGLLFFICKGIGQGVDAVEDFAHKTKLDKLTY